LKVYITLDAEGVATVTSLEQVRHGTPEFGPMQSLLTREINAAIEGALAAGVETFLVNEGHGKHRNVLPELLHRSALLLAGRNKLLHYMHGIDNSYDAMFMIGYHAGAGRRYGILSHTFHAYDLHINGRYFSEIGLAMALAGHFGVPTVLVTGDKESCRDAHDLVPSLETVAVKEGLSGIASINVHPAIVQEQIQAAAQRAMQRVDEIPPFVVEPPFVMDIDLYNTLMGDMHEYIPGCERTGDRSVRFHADNFYDLFKLFLLSSTLSMTTTGLMVMG
jgi:D-amino peptidase